MAGPASAGIVYSFDVGSFGFTYTSPDLYPQLIPAANLDRCDFGANFSCISVSIYDNYFSVSATDAAATDPSQVIRIIDVGGCPPYFAVGQVVSTTSCVVSVKDEKYRPLSLGHVDLGCIRHRAGTWVTGINGVGDLRASVDTAPFSPAA